MAKSALFRRYKPFPPPQSEQKAPLNVPSETPQANFDRRAYWTRNLTILAVLLLIWALVSLGCGVIFRPWLDQFRIPGTGFKLGFWFAQQGSIYVFVALIFIYVFLMNRLDRAHGVREQ